MDNYENCTLIDYLKTGDNQKARILENEMSKCFSEFEWAEEEINRLKDQIKKVEKIKSNSESLLLSLFWERIKNEKDTVLCDDEFLTYGIKCEKYFYLLRDMWEEYIGSHNKGGKEDD